MPLITDMMGRVLNVPGQPQRIVSLVPSQTEFLADLGLEQEVVGITKFCVHPESWFRQKARVGGTKQVHIEAVRALAPDLIIANKEENEREQIESLAGIAPVWLSDINTFGAALDMMSQIGKLCNRVTQATDIRQKIEQGFASLEAIPVKKRRVAYAIWRHPWLWVGADTFINEVLLRCGWTNVMADVPRYPELSLEAVRERQPELILLSSEPYPFSEKHIPELLSALPAARPILVDGELFSWYGSRLLQAPEYLSRLMLSC
ncbi:MAG: ABC transporter substrate-binding protein [Bacteroidetes bacterium]|nr:ABC transporter substrate-binding protein [Bacteroidota bacterium]MBS1630044.1 ABC transporter substrate-binding protein [Bacteroidota bacterium]